MGQPRNSKRNLVLIEKTETFKPPVFEAPDGFRRVIINALRRFLDLQAGSIWKDLSLELPYMQGHVLDVGCGAQIYRPLLPVNIKYLGIDTKDADDRFGYNIPDTIYFDGDTWPVTDSSVDYVLSTEVLEHIIEPESFLKEVFRCLRPGGRLILTVPFSARWHYIPHDYWRFTPSGLDILLREAGFSNIEVWARGNPLTVAIYKMMSLPLSWLFSEPKISVYRVLQFILGVLMVPLVFAGAVVANLSLYSDWGDDCLGYTVSAWRPKTEV